MLEYRHERFVSFRDNRLSWLSAGKPSAEFWWLDFVVPCEHGKTSPTENAPFDDKLYLGRDDLQLLGGERNCVLD